MEEWVSGVSVSDQIEAWEAEVLSSKPKSLPGDPAQPRRVGSSPTEVGEASVAEIFIDANGTQPVGYSDLGEAIPPHIRSYILWRDQGQCSIEGCRSRYRLQPHHPPPTDNASSTPTPDTGHNPTDVGL